MGILDKEGTFLIHDILRKGGGGRRGINNRAKKGKEKISILKGTFFLLHGV